MKIPVMKVKDKNTNEERILGTKAILMGFGLGSDAIHSPNENYPLEQFFKGIETITYFYEELVSRCGK